MARRRKQQKRKLESGAVGENSNIISGITGEGERYFQRNWLPPFVGFSLLMSGENAIFSAANFVFDVCLLGNAFVRLLTGETRMKISTPKCANVLHVDTEYTQREEANRFFFSLRSLRMDCISLCKAIFFLRAIHRQYISAVLQRSIFRVKNVCEFEKRI